MVFTAVRMPKADKDRWFAAAQLAGVSQSEFLRIALRERAERVLTERLEGQIG